MTDTTPTPTSLSTAHQAMLDDILSNLGFLAVPASAAAPNNPVVLGKRKAPPPRNAFNRGAFHQLTDVAKFTPRGGDAFWNMSRILEYGCIRLCTPERLSMIPDPEQAVYHANIFDTIFATSRLDLIPILRHLYRSSPENPSVWKRLAEHMTESARLARTQDTNTFKNNLQILLPVQGVDHFFPPIEVGTSKAKRGLAHPQLRMLIMPWKDRVHFPPLVFEKPSVDQPSLTPEAQKIYDRIVDGTYHPSSKRFPSFCYAEGTWNPEMYQQNLFKTAVIVRGIRLLLVSRSNASKDTNIKNGCLAAIHNMYRVTSPIVAYVVVQIRISISSMHEWAKKESKYYKLTDLYEKVLNAFDDTSNPDLPNWAEDTLAWLTEQVFGDASIPTREPAEEDLSEDESVVQRKRRDVAADLLALADATNRPPAA